MINTNKEFDFAINECRSIFLQKMNDYGTSWRILRTSSITDQIYIKAMRIRSIEEKGESKIDEGIYGEYIGIANYAIMALIQIEIGKDELLEMNKEKTTSLYDKYSIASKELMKNKNHDYGEAWRGMRVSSYTDIILMRILRIKQIEDNKGKTLVSEGVDSNYSDIFNYAIFALIKLTEKSKKI